MRPLSLIAALLVSVSLNAAWHRGVVRSAGFPVPGATVTATRGHLSAVAVTDQQGAYAFPDFQDGVWNVRVEMLCFAPAQREITVSAGAPAVEWELKMLPLEEMHAERHAAAPPAAAPASGPAAANSSSAFQKAEVKASPEAAKRPLPPEPPAQNREAEADDVLVNGSVNNSANSSTSQSPAFGNFRRGGNSLYYGMLSIDAGNSVLDARPFSLTGRDTARPDYSQWTGSASFGGLLWIPHLWSAAKAPWFYVNYQRTRNSSATVANGLMPEPGARNGELPAIDPDTGAPFPGGRIPENRISPQARDLLALYPLPAFPSSAGYNYQVPLLSATHRDAFRAAVIRSTQRGMISGSFAIESTRSDNPTLFGFLDTSGSRNLNGSALWTRTFGPNLFSTLNVQWNRTSSRFTPYFAYRENVSGNAGIEGNNQDPANWGPPGLSFTSGLAGLNDGKYSLTRNQTATVSYAIDRRFRNHTAKFGAGFSRKQNNALSQENARGLFTFTGAATGSDFADFLTGVPDVMSIAYGNADKYFRSGSYNAFFKDDWRPFGGLTVGLGVRWEYASPVTEIYGRLVNLETAGFTSVTPVTGASLRTDRRLVQPRLGFAWRPSPTRSLILRGGYGIYADTPAYDAIAAQMSQQPPFSKSFTLPNTAAHSLTLANGFLAPSGLAAATFAVDPSFRVGYAQSWQISVQHGLPGGMVAVADYLGTKGTHARQAIYPNTYPDGAVNPCPACPSGFEYLSSGGNTARHAAQLRLRRRLHAGLSASLQYAFAKAIDNATVGGQDRLLVAQDWRNLGAERALSSFDQRHLVTMQAQYSTGSGVRGGVLREGWRGSVMRDWTVSTEITAGSGLPLTPIYPMPVSGTGFTGSIRPDYTGAPLYSTVPGPVLNRSAYAPPARGLWGNAGRNSIEGPGQFNLNASLARTFRITDRTSFDVRLEANNALNHVVYRSWDTVITSEQFGRPDSANAMRTVRLHLQARF